MRKKIPFIHIYPSEMEQALEANEVILDAISYDARSFVCLKEPVIPVSVVREYLLGLLAEWDKLGDRKYDLPNMQVHNHIRAELDALENYCKNH